MSLFWCRVLTHLHWKTIDDFAIDTQLIANLSASTYVDPVRIHWQFHFAKDLNHIRSHCSQARTVLEEEEHEDQCERSPCLRLQQLFYFPPEDAFSESDGCCRVRDAILS
jgi:hypothetical protein